MARKHITLIDDTQAMAQRIIDTYNRASKTTQQTERKWYYLVSQECARLARKYDTSHEIVVGIVAVLSPRLAWDLNLKYAEMILKAKTLRQVLDTNMKCFKKARVKAWEIKQGANIDTLLTRTSAPKTRSFYENILSPNTSKAVTIDTWACLIASPITCTNNNLVLRGKIYDDIEAAYNIAATRLKMVAHELQAVTWIQIRLEQA